MRTVMCILANDRHIVPPTFTNMCSKQEVFDGSKSCWAPSNLRYYDLAYSTINEHRRDTGTEINQPRGDRPSGPVYGILLVASEASIH